MLLIIAYCILISYWCIYGAADYMEASGASFMSEADLVAENRLAWRFGGADTGQRPSLPEVNSTIPVPRGGLWIRHFLAFAGPGYMVSVGYMDPGNWATDLTGGAQFGYT